jgi:uncharacterized protein YdcH (DUF465 family)
MSHIPHQLHEEFPDDAAKIRELKMSNAHFAKLIETYDALNHEIHRVETRIEPTTEDVEEDLKRRRVRLKDEIAAMIAA